MADTVSDSRTLVRNEVQADNNTRHKPVSYYGTADNAPPSYVANDGPPSYESLRSRIRATRQEAESTPYFIWNVIIMILCGTVGYVLIVTLMFLLPVSMIVMGAMYRNDCTAERYIPLYLIVMGGFTLFLVLINIVQRYRKRPSQYPEDDEEGGRDRLRPFEVLISCFLLGWFIAGNVWIYRTYTVYQWTNSSAPDYCHHQFYMYSFWVTTSVYMLFASLCCCGVAASCLAYCCCRE